MSTITPTPVLRLQGITKRFGDLVANDAIDLELASGEVLALLGENGAGKTTLMNILFGHYTADEGQIEVADSEGRLQPLPPGNPAAALAAGIGMVHQHFTLADNLSAFDNLVLGTEPLWRPWQKLGGARGRLEQLMADSGLTVDLSARIADLSVGERQRVEILKALYRGARILILDEPTAVLTPQETDRLFETLRRLAAGGLAVVFISHKLHEVLAISQRVTVLRSGKVVASLPTAGTDRAQLAETMVGRAIPQTVREALPPGPAILRLHEVSVPADAGRPPLREADLTLHRHEILGIAGVSGNGQAALSNLISGLVRHDSGEVELFGQLLRDANPSRMVRLGVGRIPEDRHHDGVVGEMAVWETVMLEDYYRAPYQRFGLLQRTAARQRAEAVIRNYEVKCSGTEAVTKLLSGGNMQKLILGRVLDREPSLILANQPTRGLDVGAVTYVHRELLAARQRGAAILLISEDLDELLTLSDRIAVLYRGRLSASLPTEEVTIRQLGLMMAGHEGEAGHAA
ncbi:ABC transporter ATP-binding protein [Aquibaculum sediminis]|uniref:ABC transporter ATP-binding protein n=1 Tax=Aquibaculum sediminis TaxID=3231907 RepID=UPI003453E043